MYSFYSCKAYIMRYSCDLTLSKTRCSYDQEWSLIEVLTTLGNRWTAVFSADVRIGLDDSGAVLGAHGDVDAHFGFLSSFLPMFHPAHPYRRTTQLLRVAILKFRNLLLASTLDYEPFLRNGFLTRLQASKNPLATANSHLRSVTDSWPTAA